MSYAPHPVQQQHDSWKSPPVIVGIISVIVAIIGVWVAVDQSQSKCQANVGNCSQPTDPSQSVPIPIRDACKWAYPNIASGEWRGSVNAIECLDAAGNSLGGFSQESGHTLNDWCSNPAHTGDNPNLRQARPATDSADSWACVPIG